MGNQHTYVRPYTREQLYDCYINKDMSQRDMARYFHTNVLKIRTDMEQWGIQVKGKTLAPVQLISEEELQDCYINKEMTLKQVAEHFNSDIGRVRLAVRQANITMRIGAKKGSRLPSYPTFSLEMQKQLIECYTIQRLSIPDIAEQFDIPYPQVYRLLKRRLRRLREEATEEQSYGTNIPRGLKVIYTSYRRRANRRSFSFDLTLEQFQVLTRQNCYYCGIPPCQYTEGYTYTGIDRVDNSQGYTLGNARPCCSTCNKAKGRMTEQEFYAWIERIAAYHANRASCR